MGWELRNGRKYYYRKVRRGRHVFSEYVGADLVGIMASEQDLEEQEAHTLSRNQWKKQKKK